VRFLLARETEAIGAAKIFCLASNRQFDGPFEGFHEPAEAVGLLKCTP
jgi:hypothetical protein